MIVSTSAMLAISFERLQERLARACGLLESLLHHPAVRDAEQLGFALEGVQQLVREGTYELADLEASAVAKGRVSPPSGDIPEQAVTQ